MNRHLLLISLVTLFLFSALWSYAQPPTIGLLKTDINVSDGYTLFTPGQSHNVYLINNCGEKINEWNFEERPGSTCYLLDNGNLLRAGKDSLQIRDWNNNVIWSYATTDNGYLQHHDIEPLPNGNILLLLFDKYVASDLIAMGRDSTKVALNSKLDKIIELQPTGTNGANLVWEWKFTDHLVQDYDPTKLNYGVVVNSPELLDINFYISTIDMTHCNSVEYNDSLDQIMISSRHLCEIYIIDHSTTTAEAAGHTGGNSGMGGDFLWRWGNPQVYDQGNNMDQKLFLQHDAKWIEDGYLDAGKISTFNNGGDGNSTHSSVHIITPQIVGGVYTKIGGKFSPLDYEWSWNGSLLGTLVHENKQCGFHCLPNGNVMICETGLGRISEITKTGDHLWSYRNPVGTNVFNQYDVISSANNSIFRGEKYPPTFAGFTGQNMTPQGLIENLNPVSDSCMLTVGIDDPEVSATSIINPVINNTIQFNQFVSFDELVIMDVTGKMVFKTTHFNGTDLTVNLQPAIYFIQLYSGQKITTQKLMVR